MFETKVIIKGSILANIILLAACLMLGILLCGRTRRSEVEQRVDTLTLAEYPVKSEMQAGRALPAIDTLWRTGKIHWPLWNIRLFEYQHNAVKVITVKSEADSTLVYSATYYAPNGFRGFFEGDSFHFDTFPQPKIPLMIPQKSRIWHWTLSAGVSYRDTILSPALRAGGHLGDLQIGRVQIGWMVGELEWDLHWPLALSSYLTIRF